MVSKNFSAKNQALDLTQSFLQPLTQSLAEVARQLSIVSMPKVQEMDSSPRLRDSQLLDLSLALTPRSM